MKNKQEEAYGTEIRHLSHSHKLQLAKILGLNENWRKLFRVIPKNLEDIGHENGGFVPKYEVNMAKDIEIEAQRQENPVAMVLFDEWGTSGQSRPTVEHLYKLLNQIPLYRASDYIAEKILKIPPPERPQNGPGHKIDISLPTPSCNIELFNRVLDGQPTPGTSAIERGSIPGENQDNPRNNYSLQKRNVIPDTPSTESESTKTTTVTETDKENRPETNCIEIGIHDQAQRSSESGPNIPEYPNVPSECWSLVDIDDLPRCVLNPSISIAGNSRSEKLDNNAGNSADLPKTMENSYCLNDNWSSNVGNIPVCITDSVTTPDQPVLVGNVT